MNNTATILQLEQKSKTKEFNLTQELESDLKQLNHKQRIKIRRKILKDGTFSIYFQVRKDGAQEYKFIDVYIKPDTKKRTYKNIIDKVVIIRTHIAEELQNNEIGFQLNKNRLKIDFVQYFESVALIKDDGKMDKSWRNTLRHLKLFTKNKPWAFKNIDETKLESFREYLLTQVNGNTTHTYFSKIKAAFKKAVKAKIITENPAQFIENPQPGGNRDCLSLQEIQALSDTNCKSEQIKRAFLFSCYTGLRISDIEKLSFDNIQDNKLAIVQEKTRRTEYRKNIIKLNDVAQKIISLQNDDGIKEGYVFELGYTANNALPIIDKWAKDAGILNKKVTWHVGRHTFATLNLRCENDIYTISKLLGHKDIRSTQIYLKNIDLEKDKAIDKLPQIDL